MDWRFWTRKHSSQEDTCASLESLLSLYCDGMASSEEVRRVESHLSACADCQLALRCMETTHLVISKRLAAEPPANLRLRIAQAIAEAEQAKIKPRPLVRPIVLRPAYLAGAVAAGFVLIGALVMEHSLVTPSPTLPVPTAHPASPSTALSPPGSAGNVKAPPIGVRTANAHVGSQNRLNSVSSLKPHKAEPVVTRMAIVPRQAESMPQTGAQPLVRVISVVAPKREQASGVRLAVLTATNPVHARVKPRADKALRVTVKPTAPAVVKAVQPDSGAPTLEASNTPPAENVVTPPLSSSNVEIGAPVVVHPAHTDVLSSVRLAVRTASTQSVKVYRDGRVRVQNVALDAISDEHKLAPMYGCVYTPTSESH